MEMLFLLLSLKMLTQKILKSQRPSTNYYTKSLVRGLLRMCAGPYFIFYKQIRSIERFLESPLYYIDYIVIENALGQSCLQCNCVMLQWSRSSGVVVERDRGPFRHTWS